MLYECHVTRKCLKNKEINDFTQQFMENKYKNFKTPFYYDRQRYFKIDQSKKLIISSMIEFTDKNQDIFMYDEEIYKIPENLLLIIKDIILNYKIK